MTGTSEGDFELERPAGEVTSADGVGSSGGGTGSAPAAAGADASADGDFELRRPEEGAPSAGDAVAAGPVEDAATAEEEPAPAEGAGASAAAVGEPAPVEGSAGTFGTAVGAGAADAAAGSTPAMPEPSAAPEPPARPEPPVVHQQPVPPHAEQPKPLHDPDPYSTPPYGEPGPWAPAPPVQHPATTPSHGTAIPAPPLPQGPEISAVPLPHGTETTTPPGTGTPGTAMSAPAPTAPGDAMPPSPVHGTPHPNPTATAAPTPGGPLPPAPDDPWRRYDPWAAAAAGPLQQTGAAVPSKEQRARRARKGLVLGAVLLALVSGGIGGAVGAYLERNGGIGGVELPQAGEEPAGRDPDSVAGIAARALPSVVTLHVSGSEQSGTGTGFVLDDRGHILTNNHVVEPAGEDGEITVTFHSGDTAEAELVGGDTGYDLAVVRVKGVRGLKPVPLGNSDNVQVGDPVVAIGAPFDLAGTVTFGIISAKQRPITAGGEKGDGSDISYVDALQTDAPINPGNSGGPLLDSRGRVIGINSAIRSAGDGGDSDGGQAGSIGLGFAIPVNQGKRVAEELINTGRATHPVIGITLDMDYSGDGARVGTGTSGGRPPVTVGGPGDRAGIEPGDVITEVDGQRVHSGEELIVKIRAHRPGDRLELTIERDGKERTVSLVLGSSDD
ncbi:trypsin-like peptidase domain-containing protein [Streptomyces sp. enrichment culture]|uniref:S1C family serine protease n=1 Tax=Streptomyces sp. enrichment culture TaxID=1795815 RepID=UPI003F56896C